MTVSDYFWWASAVFWVVGFLVRLTRWKFPWSPVGFLVAIMSLEVATLTDTKIDTTSRWVLVVVLILCAMGIGWGAGLVFEQKKKERNSAE